MTADHHPQNVSLGCWVKVAEEGTADEEVFQIVDSGQANLLENRIPPDNPLARALLGAEPGDKVQLDAPQGLIEFKILDITRSKP